jgi:hypothetical protein
MPPSLYELLKGIPDPRSAQGKRYTLSGVLALIVLAMLSGANSVRQITAWGKAHRYKLDKLFDFPPGKSPSFNTIRRALLSVDAGKLEQAIRSWTRQVEGEQPEREALSGIAVDGKTARGSAGEGMPALQLLSAVTHDLPRVLFQVAVPPEKGEQGALPLLLRDLELKGQVVTLDALHTQRKVARAIRKKGAITSCA